MNNVDQVLPIVFGGRETYAQFMVLVDVICAITSCYIAISVSKYYGFGRNDLLQRGHRVAILVLSFFFAWHAEDIAVNTSSHGLTPQNLGLHVTILAVMMLSAIRLHRAAQRIESLEMGRKVGNGGLITGPFPYESRPHF